MSDKDEISKIRKEESERGRRPFHSEEKEKIRRLRSLVISALHRGNRAQFQQLLNDLGLKPGSSPYEDAMKKFEDYLRERR